MRSASRAFSSAVRMSLFIAASIFSPMGESFSGMNWALAVVAKAIRAMGRSRWRMERCFLGMQETGV